MAIVILLPPPKILIPYFQNADQMNGMHLNFIIRKLVFSLVLLVLACNASFALDPNCTHQILMHLMQTRSPSAQVDFAVVDIGSSSVKLYIKKGSTGEIISDVYRVDLGKSLGKSSAIDENAYKTLKSALKKTQLELDKHKIYPHQVQMLATAGIRDAWNSKIIVDRLAKEGYSFRILSEDEESRYVYRAVLRNQTPRTKNAVVIEVGGGSTEIVTGDNLMSINGEKSTVIKAGSGSLDMKDPFDILEVEKASQKTRKMLMEKNIRLAEEDKGMEAYVGPSFPYRALREIHLQSTGEDLFKIGLTDHWLKFYISQKGLQKLKFAQESLQLEKFAEGISNIPSKLIVLNETKKYYHLSPTIQFGSPGGMKEAIAMEVEAKILSGKIGKTSKSIVKSWTKEEGKTVENLRAVFDEDALGKMEFRVKSRKSVANKLTAKWIKGVVSTDEVSTSRFAEGYIGDGIGGRLTLNVATHEVIAKVHALLLDGIKNRKIWVKEIHNYRASGGIPYFNEAQVNQLVLAAKKANGKAIVVETGSIAEKPSGYTAFHMNQIDANGVPIEFQIRGEIVSRLAAYEHDFYDIRQGKNVTHLNQSVVNAVQSLTPSENELLINYVHDCYEYARKMELNERMPMPKLPLGLSKYPNLALDQVFQ